MFTGTGLYVDDLRAATMRGITRFAGLASILILLCVAVAWFVSRGITRPLVHLRNSMAALAEGDLTTDLTGPARTDEIGEMAAAVVVFKEHMIRAVELAAVQQTERDAAEAAKREALVRMAETIEAQTGAALLQITARTAEMAATADAMSQSASRTGDAASTAAVAAGQIRVNAQVVASATEELAASIREIGGQVGQSAATIGEAVTAGAEARDAIEALNQEVERIGTVAVMISDIASKTSCWR